MKKIEVRGSRVLGRRKVNLINGPLNRVLRELSAKGIKGEVYMRKKYSVSLNPRSFLKISTKKITGLISDLNELGCS